MKEFSGRQDGGAEQFSFENPLFSGPKVCKCGLGDFISITRALQSQEF